MKINSQEINQIDISCLQTLKAEHRKSLMLAKKDKVDYIYNTTALEGNTMTYPEVQTLLEGITVGGHKLSEEQQILNQNKSVKLLFQLIKDREFHLDKTTFQTLHKLVAYEEAIEWGKFRDGTVNIGGTEYQPPTAKALNKIFDQGIKEINQIKHPIIRAITFFLFGAKCQFFWDGNKRTSRLIMNGILLSNGYPILNIKVKDRLEFNKMMISFYDGESISDSIEFLLNYYYQTIK